MSVSKNNLDQAIVDALDALDDHDYGHEIPAYVVRNLLAALDAARGEAVATVQTITSLVGETRKCIIGPAEVIDSLPVGTAVYAAPPAALAENVAADAYAHACDRMEEWQRKRAAEGKEIGTQGSLCDGIAWLYQRVEALEAQQPAAAVPEGDGYPPELDYARAKRGDHRK